MEFNMPSNKTGNLSNSFYKVDITLETRTRQQKGNRNYSPTSPWTETQKSLTKCITKYIIHIYLCSYVWIIYNYTIYYYQTNGIYSSDTIMFQILKINVIYYITVLIFFKSHDLSNQCRKIIWWNGRPIQTKTCWGGAGIEGNFLNLISKVPVKIPQLTLYLMVKD